MPRLRWIAIAGVVLAASACHSGGSPTSPSPAEAAPSNLESIFTVTLSDPSGDQERAPQEAPPVLVAHPSADVTSVRLGMSGQFLYVDVTFAAPMPDGPVTIPAQSGMPQQFVREQGISIDMNVDGNIQTGASAFPVIQGIDIFFAIQSTYGKASLAYANYDFANGDVHQQRGHLDGVMLQSSAANHVTARYDVSSLGNFFPRGASVVVGGWAEAESSDAAEKTLYHHFAYDPYASATWTIPR